MKKLRIIIPLVIVLVAVAIISFSVALAQENEKGDSNASRLATKVAEILGLDAVVVDGAIKQAGEELRQEKLNALVENGKLTQEQADEYLDRTHSKLEGTPANGKQFFGKMGRHKGWKGHGRFFGSRTYFKGELSLEDAQKKLNAMVEDGYMTQEEAEAKLKALQAVKAD